VAYLSRETVRWLKIWLEHAKIDEGAVFRRLIGQAQIGGPLNPGTIAPIFKRVAQWIGMPARYVVQVSGFDASRCDSRSCRFRYRLGGHCPGWRVKVDEDATAVCRKDQRGAVGNG
jgi:hypothetical protein